MTSMTTGLVLATLVGALWLGGTAAHAGPPDRVTASQGVSITVEVSGDATAAPTPTPTATTGGSTGGGTGTLPKTGERIALLGGVGLILLGAGALLRVAAHRRAVGGTP